MALLGVSAALASVFTTTSRGAPATALPSGTTAAGVVAMSPASGNSDTTFSLAFSEAQFCPGDASSGYLWQTFIAPRSTDPASFTYSIGLPKASDGSDNGAKGLRTSAQFIRNNNPGLTDGRVISPSSVVLSNATYSSLSGEYWLGIACTQDDASFITQTVKYWRTPITIRPTAGAGPNNFTYSAGVTPAAPTLGALTPGDGTVAVAFTPAAVVPGNPADVDYTVIVKDSGCSSTITTVSGAASPITVGSLTNGTTYCFSVRASNSVGDSAPSGTSTAAPILPVSSVPGNKSVTLSWSAASWSSLAPLTDYVVEYRQAGGGVWKSAKKVVSTATSLTVLGLVNGLPYEFRVAGKKNTTVGEYLSVGPVIPRTVPGKPRGVKAVARNGRLELSWLAPASDGGNAITDYVIEIATSATWIVVVDGSNTNLSYSVPALTNGLGYRVRVSAVNASGAGLPQATAKPVKPYLSLPTAPQSVKATPRHASVLVTWKAPKNDGGENITDYKVEWTTDGLSWSSANAGTALSYTITGLVNGTGYRVRVSATNTTQPGYGAIAATAKPVKPYLSLPTAPQGLKVTAASSALVVTWKAPRNDGGENITNYKVEWTTDGLSWSSANAGTALSYTITGLVNGTGYRVRVSATNTTQPGYGLVVGLPRLVKPKA